MKRFSPSRLVVPLALSAVVSCSGNAPHAEAEAVEALALPLHVLVLGDSISIGYHQGLQHALADTARVVRPLRDQGGAENCAGTNNGLLHLGRWLELDDGDWDVIHFNFGLHDLKRVDAQSGRNSNNPDDPHQAEPERYRNQLALITARLKATGARLVYATTTPVPEGNLRPYREPADAVLFNQIAREVMDKAGVPINDLYAFALPRLSEIQQPENVHFHAEGSAALAAEVARAILTVAGWPEGVPSL